MKFSNYFHSPAVRVSASVIGIFIGASVALAGTLTGWYTGWIWGVLAGAGTALILTVAIPLAVWRADAPYRRIKSTIKPPLLLDQPVRFIVKNGLLSGYLVLTKDSIVLLSLDRGDHRMELSRDDVKSILLGEDDNAISIFLNNTQYIRIFSAACEEIFETFEREGWN